jgi:hypothetical protein
MLVLKKCGTTTLLRCAAIFDCIWQTARTGNRISTFPAIRPFPTNPSTRNCSICLLAPDFVRTLARQWLHDRLRHRRPLVRLCRRPYQATQRARSRHGTGLEYYDVRHIDEQFAQNFYYESYLTNASEPAAAVPVAVDDDNNISSCSKEATTKRVSLEQTAHIQALCPGATIDARALEPVWLFNECHFVSLRHDHEPKGPKLPIALCQCAPDLLTAAFCVDAYGRRGRG